jgi:hypothetical protein
VSNNQRSKANGGPGRYAALKSRVGNGGVSFGQVSGETLRGCIEAVVGAGDAILFGRTSDGGALSVRVLSDGATECWYPSDASELLELLEGLQEVLSA